jgi:hypothetical protein
VLIKGTYNVSSTIEWPRPSGGNFSIIATGPGAILQCSSANYTMFFLNALDNFAFSGLEVRNCKSLNSTMPGVLLLQDTKYINITTSYFHNNVGFPNAGVAQVDGAITLLIDNCTFDDNSGKLNFTKFITF